MKELIFSQNRIALIDDEDYDVIMQYKWYITTLGYAARESSKIISNNKREIIFMHHQIFGKPESGLVIDHIDRNKLNNQKSNFRICSIRENVINRKINKNNTSKYKGVSFKKDKKKWRAYICFNRKSIHLGYFNTKKEAAEAYNKAALTKFGEFASLNKI